MIKALPNISRIIDLSSSVGPRALHNIGLELTQEMLLMKAVSHQFNVEQFYHMKILRGGKYRFLFKMLKFVTFQKIE